LLCFAWLSYQGGAQIFDFAGLPIDITDALVFTLALELAASPVPKDLNVLLTLRLVSRGFKKTIERAAIRFLQRLRGLILTGIEERTTSSVFAARDEVLEAGVSTLCLLVESTERQTLSFLSFLRLKGGKLPGSLPPPPQRCLMQRREGNVGFVGEKVEEKGGKRAFLQKLNQLPDKPLKSTCR